MSDPTGQNHILFPLWQDILPGPLPSMVSSSGSILESGFPWQCVSKNKLSLA